MPAIRYLSNTRYRVVTHVVGHDEIIPVLTKTGDSQYMRWKGFICRHACKIIPGKSVKLVARYVTVDDGWLDSRWNTVGEDEVVLGWLVEHSDRYKTETVVYGVVGDDGWPVVLPRTGPRPVVRLASVVPIKRTG